MDESDSFDQAIENAKRERELRDSVRDMQRAARLALRDLEVACEAVSGYQFLGRPSADQYVSWASLVLQLIEAAEVAGRTERLRDVIAEVRAEPYPMDQRAAANLMSLALSGMSKGALANVMQRYIDSRIDLRTGLMEFADVLQSDPRPQDEPDIESELEDWSAKVAKEFPVRNAQEVVPDGPEPSPQINDVDREELIIAALTHHHEYESHSVLNFEPIGVRELARKHPDLTYPTVSRFFRKHFNGHSKYKNACVNGSLVTRLAILSREPLAVTSDPRALDNL